MIRESEDVKEKRFCCRPKAFKQQMAYLKKAGYEVVALDELAHYMISTNETNQQIQPAKPHKFVVITFDDGYLDTYENALPILDKFNYTATVFIVSGLVGKRNQWIRDEEYPERPLMGWREIDELKSWGITIGSHTINHRRLSTLDFEGAKNEIEGSKKFLEDNLGIAINHFAYPYGDFNDSTVKMVIEASYKSACSVKSGFNSKKDSFFELRRLDIFGTDSLLQFAIKLAFGTNDGSIMLLTKYYMNRLAEKTRKPRVIKNDP
jgi:peptidoglycan/xylan/chitin deacetylase (PgdA/CDA1 family)